MYESPSCCTSSPIFAVVSLAYCSHSSDWNGSDHSLLVHRKRRLTSHVTSSLEELPVTGLCLPAHPSLSPQQGGKQSHSPIQWQRSKKLGILFDLQEMLQGSGLQLDRGGDVAPQHARRGAQREEDKQQPVLKENIYAVHPRVSS